MPACMRWHLVCMWTNATVEVCLSMSNFVFFFIWCQSCLDCRKVSALCKSSACTCELQKDSNRCSHCWAAAVQQLSSKDEWQPPVGCPCTKRLLCKHDKRGIPYAKEVQGNWSQAHCTAPWELDVMNPDERWVYGINGGSGALLSRGLMEAINHDHIEDCLQHQ